MLNYFVLVNKKKNIIIFDYETDNADCMPDVGETDCSEWNTEKEEYMEDYEVFFDKDKAFKETGIYNVEGYYDSLDTQDGYYEDYMVTAISKLSELPY